MNILIINLHSAKNLGDDAIMQFTLSIIKNSLPKSNITAAANDPESWKKYLEIKVVSSLHNWFGNSSRGQFNKNYLSITLSIVLLTLATFLYRFFHIRLYWGNTEQRRLLTASYNADLVISCGGGNYYAHRHLSPAFILHLASLALMTGMGKRVIMLPQSIGPINGRLQQILAKIVFQSVDLIMVRENYSMKYLEEILAIPRKPILFPDLAFGVQQTPSLRHTKEFRYPLKIGMTVIDRTKQNPSFTGQDEYEHALVETILNITNNLSAEVHLFVQCYGPSIDQDDQVITSKIYKQAKLLGANIYHHAGYMDALRLLNDIKGMDIIVGSRLHTGIFALICNLPVVLISYQPKSVGMMEFMDLQEYVLEIQDVNGNILINKIQTAIEYREELCKRIATHHALANEQIRLLGDVLSRESQRN